MNLELHTARAAQKSLAHAHTLEELANEYSKDGKFWIAQRLREWSQQEADLAKRLAEISE